MDPDPNLQGANPVPSMACEDAKRLRCSAMPADPVPKVLNDDNTSSWPAPVPPLDDANLLQEILIRLPPQPSSLPRASLVCTPWRNILSDPQFLGRFRKHHRKPPLLGFFVGHIHATPVFTPVLEPPDRIPSTRFSVPESCSSDQSRWNEQRWIFAGVRHGLAVIVHRGQREIVVWDPLTGQQHRVTFPPGLAYEGVRYFQAAVLCADSDDGHVHDDCFLSPFKLVLICRGNKQALGSLYDSVSGVWGNIVSVAITDRILMDRLLMARPSILVRNALCWSIFGGDVLAFDFEMQSLCLIEKPAHNHFTDGWRFQLLRMEDGGLGLAVLSKLTVQLWERKSNFDGVFEWVLLQKTIPLEGMLPRGVDSTILFVGYGEDTNVIVLTTRIGNFMLQLDSMKVKHIVERDQICYDIFYPYTNFYTAVRDIACGDGGAENLNT